MNNGSVLSGFAVPDGGLGHCLDFGSYPYNIPAYIVDRCSGLCGLDFHGRSQKHGHHDLYDSIRPVDIERQKIPYDTDSFDSVLFLEVLEHLGYNPLHTLREIHRILKPTGRLYLSTPNLLRASVLKGYLLHDMHPQLDWTVGFPNGNRGHLREYSMAEARRLLCLAGLRAVRSCFARRNTGNDSNGSVRAWLAGLLPWHRAGICITAEVER